jgi:K+/H+ antiporter YhaU regulatory subunit KhtT
MGANAIFNIVEREDINDITEGLNVFNVQTPSQLEGRSLQDSSIRQETGCNVLSIKTDSKQIPNPEPERKIPEESELVLVGTNEDEKKFMDLYKE